MGVYVTENSKSKTENLKDKTEILNQIHVQPETAKFPYLLVRCERKEGL